MKKIYLLWALCLSGLLLAACQGNKPGPSLSSEPTMAPIAPAEESPAITDPSPHPSEESVIEESAEPEEEILEEPPEASLPTSTAKEALPDELKPWLIEENFDYSLGESGIGPVLQISSSMDFEKAYQSYMALIEKNGFELAAGEDAAVIDYPLDEDKKVKVSSFWAINPQQERVYITITETPDGKTECSVTSIEEGPGVLSQEN